jgi:hypothetical protein
MDLMLATHNKDEKLSEDDPQTSYLISSWARMCKVMGMCYLINCVLVTNKEQFNRSTI